MVSASIDYGVEMQVFFTVDHMYVKMLTLCRLKHTYQMLTLCRLKRDDIQCSSNFIIKRMISSLYLFHVLL